MIEKLYWDDKDAIALIGRALSANQVVAGTSDTVWGLLAPLSRAGFERLNSIKGRSDKPYLILIGDKKNAVHFVENSQSFHIEKIITACWPGPLTLILKARADLPDFMKAEEGTIALRMPNHAGLLQLLARFDGLFSTSANRAGQPVPMSIDDLDPVIMQAISYLIIDREEQVTTKPSTILDCSNDHIRVVREGAYSVGKLKRILGAKLR